LQHYIKSIPLSITTNTGFQAKAREWRRNECIKIINKKKQIANNFNNKQEFYISTAHHENDQLETLMLKFLRGAHISNLSPVLDFK
jgi:tRNA(Ile)-lysidine synthase TilS/MesJ